MEGAQTLNGGPAAAAGAPGGGGGPANVGRNGEQRDPIINARDRLFHTLFFRISLAYARGCPRQIRRLIECLFLIKAVICMCMLVYIHLVYTRQPVQCLEHLADKWPRDGVLRVEIQRGGPTPGYDIYTSYEKERRLALRQRELENLGSFFSIITGDLGYTETIKSGDGEEGEEGEEEEGLLPTDSPSGLGIQQQEDDIIEQQEIDEIIQNIMPSAVGIMGNNTTTAGGLPGSTSLPGGQDHREQGKPQQEEKISTLSSTLDYMKDRLHSLQEALKEEKGEMTNERLDSISEYGQDIGAQASKLKTVIVNMTDELSGTAVGGGKDDGSAAGAAIAPGGMEEGASLLDDRSSDLEKLSRLVWAEDGYIIEYSLEIGFLRLSPAMRQKLNIPVHIEILDPNTNPCFGDAFSRFILENMLGYEDVLMSSVKTLAEKENNKGFLRNVVTGAQYHFKAKWTSVTSYIPAVLVMIVFTISISMLLRYSQHQIFVFIIDLLQMVELNTNITFPVAPLLTVILALVGMEAIMSEFFEDTTTAFYIILLVWLCDQYDSICCHTPITKRYWLRFFYLYHTAFYAYHYRFSGQYSGLALLTMWLFTQHSMIYFFHHYELPVILQQAQIRDIINRSNGQVHINFNNVVSLNNNNNNIAANANNNNNNAAANNNNVVRRIIRPRFTFGRFQFRFVFQAMHNPPVPPQAAATSANAANAPPSAAENSPAVDGSNSSGATVNNTESTRSQGENNQSNLPPLATSNDVLDTAALQRYASEVVESARQMEQLESLAGGRMVIPPAGAQSHTATGSFDRQESSESYEDLEETATTLQPQHLIHNEEDKHITSPPSNSSSCIAEGSAPHHVTDSTNQTVDSTTTNENSLLLLSKSSDSQANVIDSIINENTEEVMSDREGVIKNCDNNDVIVSKSAAVENVIPTVAITAAVTDTDAIGDGQSSSSQNLPAAATENKDAINSAGGNGGHTANENKSDENAESIRNDLREIRSSLADAAREAADLIQDLGNLSQQ